MWPVGRGHPGAPWGLMVSGAVLGWSTAIRRRGSWLVVVIAGVVGFLWWCDHLVWFLAAQGLLTGLSALLVGSEIEGDNADGRWSGTTHRAHRWTVWLDWSTVPGDHRETAPRTVVLDSSSAVSDLRGMWVAAAWADGLLVLGSCLAAVEAGTLRISALGDRQRVAELVSSAPNKVVLAGLLCWLGLWGRLQLFPFVGLRDGARRWSSQTNTVVWGITLLPLMACWCGWGSVWWSAAPVMAAMIPSWCLLTALAGLWCALTSRDERVALAWLWSAQLGLAAGFSTTLAPEVLLLPCCLGLLAAGWLFTLFGETESPCVQRAFVSGPPAFRALNGGFAAVPTTVAVWLLAVLLGGGVFPAGAWSRASTSLVKAAGLGALSDDAEPLVIAAWLPAVAAAVCACIGLLSVAVAVAARARGTKLRLRRLDVLLLIGLSVLAGRLPSPAKDAWLSLELPGWIWLAGGTVAGVMWWSMPETARQVARRAMAPLIAVGQQRFLLPALHHGLVNLPLRGLAQLGRVLEWAVLEGVLYGSLRGLVRRLGQDAPHPPWPVAFQVLSLGLALAALALTVMWLSQ